jgi:hypothetical protein
VYGLDLGDGGLREQPLSIARDDNRLAASDSFTLRSGLGDRRGFFAVAPIYAPGLPHATTEDRRRNLVGFVQAAFQTSVMVHTILSRIQTPLVIYLFSSEAPEGLPIYVHASGSGVDVEPKTIAQLSTGRYWTGLLQAADLRWTMIAIPAPNAQFGRPAPRG